MKNKIIFIALFLIVGCENKLQWIKLPEVPVVFAITPNTGTVGTLVKISGANFSAAPLNDIVTINGTPATITEASLSTITFIAPNETTGPVVVTISNKTAENKPVFTYQ